MLLCALVLLVAWQYPVTVSGRTRVDSPVLRVVEGRLGSRPAPAPTPISDLPTSRLPAVGDSHLSLFLAAVCQVFCYLWSETFLTDARLSGLEETLQSCRLESLL